MDIQLLLTLIAGHYLADFGLQTQFVAETKRLVFKESIGFHALTAHAFIHGLVAGVITNNFTAAAIIGVTHWLIDFGKASPLANMARKKPAKNKHQEVGLYGINIDQLLHMLVILAVVTFVL